MLTLILTLALTLTLILTLTLTLTLTRSGYPPFVAVSVGAKCAQQVTSDVAGLRVCSDAVLTACSVLRAWANAPPLPRHLTDPRSSQVPLDIQEATLTLTLTLTLGTS